MDLESTSQEREPVKDNAKWLFLYEPKYMAHDGSFQNPNKTGLRDSVVSRIRQLCKTLEEIPGPQYEVLVQFHAITYFDRCFYNLPDLGDQEYLDTFIIACIVIAGKRMSKSNDFPMQLFLEKNGLVNKLAAIENMECRIRDMLYMRMESITALSFIDFFLSLIYDNDPVQIQTAKANHRLYFNILFMHRHAEFVQFKPSIIAAVGIVAEKTENGPVGNFCDPILRCKYVDTDQFEKCFDLLKSRLKPPQPPTH